MVRSYQQHGPSVFKMSRMWLFNDYDANDPVAYLAKNWKGRGVFINRTVSHLKIIIGVV